MRTSICSRDTPGVYGALVVQLPRVNPTSCLTLSAAASSLEEGLSNECANPVGPKIIQ